MTSPTGDQPAIPPIRRNLAYAGIVLVILMTNMDGSIVNLALPQLSRALRVSPQATVWVTTTYLLACACAVPATAALGDQLGRRRLFLTGVPMFTLASLGCAMAPTLPVLVAWRVVQGLGAAMLFAVLIPIMRMMFPPERMGAVFGVNAMATAVGVCVGPSLSGLVLSHLTWPWLFLINLPVGVIAILTGFIGIPDHHGTRGSYDWPGALTAGGAIAAFIIGVHELVDVNTLWIAGVLIAAALVMVVSFVRCEKQAERPVLPLSMWNGVFSLSVTTAFWSFFGQGVAFVALPFLFQSAYGATPLRAALLFTPWPAAIVMVSPLIGRLSDRIRPGALAASGLAVYLVGLLALALLGDQPTHWEVLCFTGLAGLGFGIFQSPNNKEMQAAVPIALASSGAAVLNLNRSVAQSAGSGMVSMALVLSGASAGSTLQEAHAAAGVLWVAVLGALFSLVLSAAKVRTATRIDNMAVTQ